MDSSNRYADGWSPPNLVVTGPLRHPGPGTAVGGFVCGYEPVASVLFKIVVLGVMSSMFPRVEEESGVLQRIRDAAGYCVRGLDQVCVSHQCGFSSSLEGHELREVQQWAKVRRMVEIAGRAWSVE